MCSKYTNLKKCYHALATISLTLFVTLAVDWFMGDRLLKLANITSDEKGQAELRISNPHYHHGLAPNYIGTVTWGGNRVCLLYKFRRRTQELFEC